jgi:phosphoglycolate phosphatase
LFDLDGTLVDSALDLGGAGNDLRERRGLPPLPLEVFRPLTGTGARGMLRVALGTTPEDADFEALKDEYLAIYATRLTRLTRVFDAMAPVLDALDAAALPWGIVTNKHSRFAEPVVAGTGLATRSRVLVCGDTTARAKPFPDPLLEAARRLAVDPAHCLYVGDDLRDIQAGRAAGMGTVAAAWGYLGDGEPIEAWGADHLARTPAGLLEVLRPGR